MKLSIAAKKAREAVNKENKNYFIWVTAGTFKYSSKKPKNHTGNISTITSN